MENMSSIPPTHPVIPFQSGSPIIIAEPTNSGKNSMSEQIVVT